MDDSLNMIRSESASGQLEHRELVSEYERSQQTTAVDNKIQVLLTSTNGETDAGQYPCGGWVKSLAPTLN